MKKKKKKYCGAGIIFWRISKDDTLQFLLGKRTHSVSHAAGQWSCFGGKKEPGETFRETAKRIRIGVF